MDEEKLRVELQKLRLSHDFVLVDGNMITELPSVLNLFHTIVFIQLDYETCKERRQRRTDYDPPDGIGSQNMLRIVNVKLLLDILIRWCGRPIWTI